MSVFRRRPGRALIGAGVLSALLSGCGADSLGVTGISVDATGSPVIVLGVCRGHLDSAGLLDTGTDGQAYSSAGEWAPNRPVGPGVTRLPVAAPPAGWVQERPLRPLVPGVTYAASGSTADHQGATDMVSFGVADLRTLTPETLLYQDDESLIRAPVGGFLDIACPADPPE